MVRALTLPAITWDCVEAALEEVLGDRFDRRTDCPRALAIHWLFERDHYAEAEFAATHPDELAWWMAQWQQRA